ncbi:MAG: hypothetical protein ACTSRU_09435 [Candidatus Hodarchaeales archaeon]
MQKSREIKLLIPAAIFLFMIVISQLHFETYTPSNTLALGPEEANEVVASWEIPYATAGHPENLQNSLMNILFYLEPYSSSSVLRGQFNTSGSLQTEFSDELENVSVDLDIARVSARLSSLKTDVELLNLTLKSALEESLTVWLDDEFINHRTINRTTFNNTFSEFYNYYLLFFIYRRQNPGIIFNNWFPLNNNSIIIKNRVGEYIHENTGLNIDILKELLQTNTTGFPRELVNRMTPVIEELTGMQTITFDIMNDKNYTREREYEDFLTVFFIDNDQSLGGIVNNLSLKVDSLESVISGDELLTFIHVAVITDNITGAITRNITWTYNKGTASERPVSEFFNFVKWAEYGNGHYAVDAGLSELLGVNISYINHYFTQGANKSVQILPGTFQRYPGVVFEQFSLFSADGTIDEDGFEIMNSRFWYSKHVFDSIFTFNDEGEQNGVLDFDSSQIDGWPFVKGGSEFKRRASLMSFESDPVYTPPDETEKGDLFSVSFKNMTIRFSDYQADEFLADFNLVKTEERTIPEYCIQVRTFPSPSRNSFSLKLNTIFTGLTNFSGVSDLGAGLSMLYTSQFYQHDLGKISARMNYNSYYDPDINESWKLDQIYTVFAKDIVNSLVRVDFTEIPYLYKESGVVFPSAQVVPVETYRVLSSNKDIAKQLNGSQGQDAMSLFCLLNYPSWNGYGFEHGPAFYFSHGRKELFISEPVTTQENIEESYNTNLIQFYLDLILYFAILPITLNYTLPPVIKYSKRELGKKWTAWKSRTQPSSPE